MNYLQKIEKELSEILKNVPAEVTRDATKYMKAKILESYRNGIETGGKPKKQTYKPARK